MGIAWANRASHWRAPRATTRNNTGQISLPPPPRAIPCACPGDGHSLLIELFGKRSLLHKMDHIPSQYIRFYIQQGANLDRAKIGMLLGIGDESKGETIGLAFDDG